MYRFGIHFGVHFRCKATILGKCPWQPPRRMILKWEAIIQFSESPSPKAMLEQWAGLLNMNQHQHCAGGVEGRWTERPYVGKLGST